jgi:3',5'-cyclic AMP phosphodiesterase CpdA
MLVAHLSDPHVTVGPLAAEPASGLRRALGRALALDPRPDCVVVTGDLVDNGSPAEYAALSEIVAGFPLPLRLVAGNHDSREPLLDAFGGGALLGGAFETRYSVELAGATLVVLDSSVPGSHAGQLGQEQLNWLDDALARRPDLPALVCLHHPPIAVGIAAMDDIRLRDGEAFAAVVARHPHVVRVLAGHLHRVVSAGFAGTVLSVAPSTYRQIDLCLRPGGQLGYVPEPTGFLLHALIPAGCVTHLVQVSHAAAPLGGFP